MTNTQLAEPRDGTLDLDDDVLSELDVDLAAVHSAFDMTEAAMTDRITRAMENPLVHVLCHPTGRRLGRRAHCPADPAEILRARRGWLRRSQVLNTGTLAEVTAWLGRRHD